MGIVMSLEEVQYMYKHFFTFPMPSNMSFTAATRALVRDIGEKKLKEVQKELAKEKEETT